MSSVQRTQWTDCTWIPWYHIWVILHYLTGSLHLNLPLNAHANCKISLKTMTKNNKNREESNVFKPSGRAVQAPDERCTVLKVEESRLEDTDYTWLDSWQQGFTLSATPNVHSGLFCSNNTKLNCSGFSHLSTSWCRCVGYFAWFPFFLAATVYFHTEPEPSQ